MIKIRLLSLTVILLLVCSIAAAIYVESAQAVTIQEIKGKLGGADYLVRIPSNWNKDLVVYCRGYSHLLSGVNLVGAANNFNAMVGMGFAFAETDYGSGGYCVKDAVIRTHQLTEYVKDNFGVTGKIYLVGISMGGNTVLELGAKYPDLYAGVLDICGSKNLISQYYDKMYYAGLTSDVDLAAAVVARGGVNPPYPLPTIADFRGFSFTSGNDIALACGGTPEEKPKAYERISPTFSAYDIAIPTITVQGTADALVPYQSSIDFMNAVTAAGHADIYRFYKVVGGQHANGPVVAQISIRLGQLVNWVENGVPAPASSI